MSTSYSLSMASLERLIFGTGGGHGADFGGVAGLVDMLDGVSFVNSSVAGAEAGMALFFCSSVSWLGTPASTTISFDCVLLVSPMMAAVPILIACNC